MGAIINHLSNLKTWHIGGLIALAALLVLIGSLGYGTSNLLGGGTQPDSAESSSTITAQDTPAAGEIAVRSRLTFPRRAELTFDIAGEVEEILVSQGDWVTAGQALARLDTDHFPALEREMVQLRYDILAARDTILQINLDFSDEPLQALRREEAVAGLELAINQAEEFLEDVDRNHADALTATMENRKQAQLALDRARDDLEEVLADLDADHEQVLAESFRARADAELALDRALERLDDYNEDLERGAIRAQDLITTAELALELARDALTDFIDEHDRITALSRTQVGAAEVALDAAQTPLTSFLRSPSRDLEADNKPIDIPLLRRLQAAVALAESQLDKARSDLAELEEGPDQFLLETLESNVTVAELNLTQARDDLAELEEGPDQFIVEQIEAEVDLARVILAQAQKFLNENLEGPDRLILRRLGLAVELAETRLELAERNVNELIEEGIDRAAVALSEKQIATRRAEIEQLFEEPDALQLLQIETLEAGIILSIDRMGDIREDMEETLLRAPFDGVIFLMNLEVDDRVNKYSRVMKLLDPRVVMVEGLIDAADAPLVTLGAAARVGIGSLPGQELTGTVTVVGQEPSTQRGIVSYPISILVDLPAGTEVPPRLSAVTSVIIP